MHETNADRIDLIALPHVPDWAGAADPVRAYLARANIGLLSVGVAVIGPTAIVLVIGAASLITGHR